MKKLVLLLTLFVVACDLTGGGSTAVSPVIGSTTLSLSLSTLALSVTGLTEYGVSGTPSSGVARTITVTNTGSNSASNLVIDYPSWPSGTTASSDCGSTLAAAATCTITITPGATASSDGSNPCSDGTTPNAGVLSIGSDNASTVTANVYILSYGCVYQGGYVYAFDDTPNSSETVAGKVLAVSDQAAPYPSGIIWSSDGSGPDSGDIVYDSIYGISETSTTSSANPNSGVVSGQTACNGAIDGSCNTNNIYTYYENNAPSAPINLNYYAAGLCKQTISGYSDWYLPAACELGFDATSTGTGCGSSGTPTTQNAQSSLVDFNSLNLLSGYYHSSTESSGSPASFVISQYFTNGGGSVQNTSLKNNLLGVRCSRLFF
ncbi:MAG: hypothetical protein R3A80_03860 [Bdellovibrionota bacterium]